MRFVLAKPHGKFHGQLRILGCYVNGFGALCAAIFQHTPIVAVGVVDVGEKDLGKMKLTFDIVKTLTSLNITFRLISPTICYKTGWKTHSERWGESTEMLKMLISEK